MKIEQKFDGRDKSEWYYTYQIAGTHLFLWPIFLIWLCGFVYLLSFSFFNYGIFSPQFIFTFVMSLIAFWGNFTGLHSMYLCTKFQIDYKKNWNEV